MSLEIETGWEVSCGNTAQNCKRRIVVGLGRITKVYLYGDNAAEIFAYPNSPVDGCTVTNCGGQVAVGEVTGIAEVKYLEAHVDAAKIVDF